MAKIFKKITDLIGNTPLVELSKYSEKRGLKKPVVAKVEFFNPGGSVKDRIALAMIEDAEKKGLLKPGATIIEPTSGNTGVGLALVSAVKGYHLILTMPETMSVERRNLVKAYGAEVRLTSGKEGMPGAIKAAEELRDSIPGSIILGQFVNAANPQKHYETTGPEIWRDTDGKIDILVAGVGTGGTISGIARYLKEQNPNIQVIAVEPATSPVLNGGKSGPHKIQGIGAGFIPDTYNAKYIDEVLDIQRGARHPERRCHPCWSRDSPNRWHSRGHLIWSRSFCSHRAGKASRKREQEYRCTSARYWRKISFYRTICL